MPARIELYTAINSMRTAFLHLSRWGAFLCLLSALAFAQSPAHDMSGMDMGQMHEMPAPTALAHYGSGTGWQPASSPE